VIFTRRCFYGVDIKTCKDLESLHLPRQGGASAQSPPLANLSCCLERNFFKTTCGDLCAQKYYASITYSSSKIDFLKIDILKNGYREIDKGGRGGRAGEQAGGGVTPPGGAGAYTTQGSKIFEIN